MYKTKMIEIPGSEELIGIRNDHKLTQGDLCEIMGMSRKSYTMIYKHERGIAVITDFQAWEKLQEYRKIKENKH